MPEIPDLEVFSHNLTKMLGGKKVAKVVVTIPKKLNVTADKLNDTLAGQELKKVSRDGKELHLEFGKGDALALHLMLHGALYISDGMDEHKYKIIEIHFKDDTIFGLTDFQKMAKPTLNPEPSEGVDALSAKLTASWLTETLGKSKSGVKNVLTDQHIIRGIGNAYADEILWDARISPFVASNKIPEEKVIALAKSIRSVIKDAKKQILKHNPDIISGEVRDFLKIHHPKKDKSPGGAEIRIKTTGGRKTYYTDEQEEY